MKTLSLLWKGAQAYFPVEKNPPRKNGKRWPRHKLVYPVVLAWIAVAPAWPQAASAAGTWSETGPLAGARGAHNATLLPDGRITGYFRCG